MLLAIEILQRPWIIIHYKFLGPLKLHMRGITFGIVIYIIRNIQQPLKPLWSVDRSAGRVAQGWKESYYCELLRSTPPLRVLIGAYFYADKMFVSFLTGRWNEKPNRPEQGRLKRQAYRIRPAIIRTDPRITALCTLYVFRSTEFRM